MILGDSCMALLCVNCSGMWTLVCWHCMAVLCGHCIMVLSESWIDLLRVNCTVHVYGDRYFHIVWLYCVSTK